MLCIVAADSQHCISLYMALHLYLFHVDLCILLPRAGHTVHADDMPSPISMYTGQRQSASTTCTAYLASKGDAQRVCMLGHYELSHVCQSEVRADTMLPP